MSITDKGLRTYGAAVLASLALGVTGCSSPDRTSGQAINDTLIDHNVGHALSTDPVLKYPDVKVNVYNGTAQLTGFVDSEEQRTRAAQIAAGVPGVTKVVNEITLKPTPTGRAPIQDVSRDPNAPVSDPNLPPPPPK